MKYCTYTEIQSIRPNKQIWACAYDMNKSKETMALKCLPIKGIIKNE